MSIGIGLIGSDTMYDVFEWGLDLICLVNDEIDTVILCD